MTVLSQEVFWHIMQISSSGRIWSFKKSSLQLLFQVGWFSKVQRVILRINHNHLESFNKLRVTQLLIYDQQVRLSSIIKYLKCRVLSLFLVNDENYESIHVKHYVLIQWYSLIFSVKRKWNVRANNAFIVWKDRMRQLWHWWKQKQKI